jgi:uncharacterized protein
MLLARREFFRLSGGALAALAVPRSLVRMADAESPVPLGPVIDVHMHAYPASMQLDTPIVNPISGVKSPIRTGADHLTACLAAMRRHNVVRGVVSGGDGDRLRAAVEWSERDPARFLVGAGIRGSADTPLPPVEALRRLHAEGKLQVIGEVTSQYAGLPLSDPEYEPYLALAEELDLPVALHTGTMPPGTSFDPCCRLARARFGNPALVEEVLNRHPKLRLNLMHGGWPYLEDTIAMLMLYPNVYTDTGAIDWLLPPTAFHEYLRALVEAGFGKRIMFGSDHMFWPDAIGLGIQGITTAPFLTDAQKRDVLYHNAVRFYGIDTRS